jgi:(S)-sulfolactate dehydrogenase
VGFDPQIPVDAACWQETGARGMSFDDALRAADVVTVHVPLVESTHHLLGPAQLEMLKPHAVLINTSRGGVIDESALAEALTQGRLGGAALDVFADEPLKAGSPLAGVSNLILTPHIAGLTMQSNERVSTLVASRVMEALLAGEHDSTTTKEL